VQHVFRLLLDAMFPDTLLTHARTVDVLDTVENATQGCRVHILFSFIDSSIFYVLSTCLGMLGPTA
jgi:hypothetical protein